jgi:plasmid stabilization system protein ParE
VARLVIAASADGDLDRLFAFLADQHLRAALSAGDVIFDGLELLKRHPLIGRPVEDGMRELLISRGKTGYVALYQYVAKDDVVMAVALRHQREAGFCGEP